MSVVCDLCKLVDALAEMFMEALLYRWSRDLIVVTLDVFDIAINACRCCRSLLPW